MSVPFRKWANRTARRPAVLSGWSAWVTRFQRPGGVRDGAGVAADRCRSFLHIIETSTTAHE